MRDYETIPEAIEIVRTTYKGRKYTMGLYKGTDDKDEFVEKVIGEAAYFYAQQLFHDMKNDGFNFWPINDDDVEAMALMETIFAVPIHRAPAPGFETVARDLLNEIVKEFEERWSTKTWNPTRGHGQSSSKIVTIRKCQKRKLCAESWATSRRAR